ncbi:MAG TPA: hypothetical protein VFB06_30145 [Streptosporangiaceae bacterium]|nr:hypothetical protein [Streptosporangiaceae bacterium]
MDRTGEAGPRPVHPDEAAQLKADMLRQDIERTRRRLAETAEQLAALTGIKPPAGRHQAARATHATWRHPLFPAAVSAAAGVLSAALVAIRRWRKR